MQKYLNDAKKYALDFHNLTLEQNLLYFEALDQVHIFRTGHWMFVQEYIMANTKHAVATGRTPITTWLPNQIKSVLQIMSETLSFMIDQNISHKLYIKHFRNLDLKIKTLEQQMEELEKEKYDPTLVQQINKHYKENELKSWT